MRVRERLFLNMCWSKVVIRLSHLILKQYYEGGGALPSLQSPEAKFSQLVKFPSQDLDLAPVETLKGTEVMRSRAVSQGLKRTGGGDRKRHPLRA